MKGLFDNKIFYRDLLVKVLVMFAAAYVALFGLETVLPGLVTEVFNLNFMLLTFFGALILLLALPFDESGNEGNSTKGMAGFFWLLAGYLMLVLFFALYRVSILESLWYMILAFFVLKGFYRMIE